MIGAAGALRHIDGLVKRETGNEFVARTDQNALADAERAELTRPFLSTLTSVRLAHRARIVLLAAEGMQSKDIPVQFGVGRVLVSRWRERYTQSRPAALSVTFRVVRRRSTWTSLAW